MFTIRPQRVSHHSSNRSPAKSHRGREVDLKDPGPIFISHPHEQLVTGDSRVVYEDIH